MMVPEDDWVPAPKGVGRAMDLWVSRYNWPPPRPGPLSLPRSELLRPGGWPLGSALQLAQPRSWSPRKFAAEGRCHSGFRA